MKNYIITTALPYANGNLHIGHFFEAVLADIKVRYYKSKNIPCYFVSGDDAHGAATTLYCAKHNLNTEEHLCLQHAAHKDSYNKLKIQFDNFSITNSLLHKQVVNWCVEKILEFEKQTDRTIFVKKDVESWYDNYDSQFLPDRYVIGQCPHCLAYEQSPEICEICNKRIVASTLINPINNLTKKDVVLKQTKHLLLNTAGFYEELKKYENLFDSSIKNKIFDGSLASQELIDISRDGPYYGLEVSHFDDLNNQYYYVWFDAIIGYLTFSFELWLENKVATKELFTQYCSSVELEHFIGKDISYFHSFLWVNLLKTITGKTVAPIKQINLHGWITFNHIKLSKSKGNSLDLSKLTSSQIDAVRLYLFSKYDGSITDTELIEEDISKIYNHVIVQNLANFYARLTRLLNKHDIKVNLEDTILSKYEEYLINCNYKKLYETVCEDLRNLNVEFQQQEVWKLEKNKLEELANLFLIRWYKIYKILAIISPSLQREESRILNNEFFHLAENIDNFQLFDK